MADMLQSIMQGLDLPDPAANQSLVGQQQGNPAPSPLQQAAPQGRTPVESPEDSMFKQQMRLIGADTGDEGALTKLAAVRDKANKDQVDNLMSQSEYSTLDKVMAGLRHANLNRVGPGISSLASGLQGTADAADSFSDLKDKYKQMALDLQSKQAEKAYADQWEQAKQARALTMAANNAKYKIQNAAGGKGYVINNTPNGSILLNKDTGEQKLVDVNNFTAIRAQIHTDIANKARELGPDFLSAAGGDQTIASSLMQSYVSQQENKALHDINLPGVAQGAGAPTGSMLPGLPGQSAQPQAPAAPDQPAAPAQPMPGQPLPPQYQGTQLPPAELAKIRAAAQKGNPEAQAVLKAYAEAQQGGQPPAPGQASGQAPGQPMPDLHVDIPQVHDIIKTSADKEKADKLAQGDAKRILDAPSAQVELANHNAALDRMDLYIKKLLDSSGIQHMTGPIMGKLPTFRNDSGDAETDLHTLTTQEAFNTLQEMRAASKTGGALGSVSDAEEKMLMDYLAPLASVTQTPAHLKQALLDLQNWVAGSKQRAAQAYKTMYGTPVQDKAPLNTSNETVVTTPASPALPAPISAKAKLKVFK